MICPSYVFLSVRWQYNIIKYNHCIIGIALLFFHLLLYFILFFLVCEATEEKVYYVIYHVKCMELFCCVRNVFFNFEFNSIQIKFMHNLTAIKNEQQKKEVFEKIRSHPGICK